MLTSEIYWASKDPRLFELTKIVLPDGTGLPDIAARYAKGQELDAAGLSVDRQTMLWGWDPILVMADRATPIPGFPDGLPWVPNAYQGNLDSSVDMSKPWERAIRVSLNEEDYPPFATAPAPAPAEGPVGKLIGNGIYAFNLAACRNPQTGRWLFPEGYGHVAPDGVMVYWHMGFGPLGIPAQQWETAAARDKRHVDERTAVPQ